MRRMGLICGPGLVLLGMSGAFGADLMPGWVLRQPADIQWRAAENLPPGAMVATLEGDPTKEGFFTMRIKMPDGYRVPPHWHSQPERVTVLSGVLNLGSGDTFDASATMALPAGTYSSMPPRMSHFGWMTGETVLQLSTMGPWTITYVNPADDPRNSASGPVGAAARRRYRTSVVYGSRARTSRAAISSMGTSTSKTSF